MPRRRRRWDLDDAGAAPTRLLLGHVAPVVSIAGGEGHPRFASASADGTVRIWDLATGEARGWMAHNGSIGALQLLPDGSWLSVGGDGMVRRWSDDAPHDEAGLRPWIAAHLERAQ